MDSRRDPVLLAAYAVLAGAIVLLDPPSVLAVVLAAPLVLLVPGLSLVMALDIDGDPALPWRRLVVSIALSIAVVALGGILVNAVAPLTKSSWLVLLVVFTCLCSAVTFLRARHAWATPFPRPFSGPDRPPVMRLWRWAAVGIVVLLLLAGAATLTEITSRNAYDTPLVELSLLPVPGGGGKVELSVVNRSGRTERLRLTIVDGRGSTKVEDLELPASGSWTDQEPVGPAGLSAVLARPDRPRPVGMVSWSGEGPAPAVAGAQEG